MGSSILSLDREHEERVERRPRQAVRNRMIEGQEQPSARRHEAAQKQ